MGNDVHIGSKGADAKSGQPSIRRSHGPLRAKLCHMFTPTHAKTMTTDCAMIDSLMDDAGVISWENACRVAASHSLYEDFVDDFWAKCCYDYDAGLSAEKLAIWLGY